MRLASGTDREDLVTRSLTRRQKADTRSETQTSQVQGLRLTD